MTFAGLEDSYVEGNARLILKIEPTGGSSFDHGDCAATDTAR